MKTMLQSIGIMLFLVSPSYSALMTDDLEVISPTGIPLSHEHCEQSLFSPSSSYTITIRLIETSRGVLLVREYTRGEVVQLSRSLDHSGTSTVAINSSSSVVCEKEMTILDVNLE